MKKIKYFFYVPVLIILTILEDYFFDLGEFVANYGECANFFSFIKIAIHLLLFHIISFFVLNKRERIEVRQNLKKPIILWVILYSLFRGICYLYLIVR